MAWLGALAQAFLIKYRSTDDTNLCVLLAEKQAATREYEHRACRRNFQPTVSHVPYKLGLHLGPATGLFLGIKRCRLFFFSKGVADWFFFSPKALRCTACLLCAGYISDLVAAEHSQGNSN